MLQVLQNDLWNTLLFYLVIILAHTHVWGKMIFLKGFIILTGASLKFFHLRLTFNIFLGGHKFYTLCPDDNLTCQEIQKGFDIYNCLPSLSMVSSNDSVGPSVPSGHCKQYNLEDFILSSWTNEATPGIYLVITPNYGLDDAQDMSRGWAAEKVLMERKKCNKEKKWYFSSKELKP